MSRTRQVVRMGRCVHNSEVGKSPHPDLRERSAFGAVSSFVSATPLCARPLRAGQDPSRRQRGGRYRPGRSRMMCPDRWPPGQPACKMSLALRPDFGPSAIAAHHFKHLLCVLVLRKRGRDVGETVGVRPMFCKSVRAGRSARCPRHWSRSKSCCRPRLAMRSRQRHRSPREHSRTAW